MPPAGLHLAALSSRLVTARSSAAGLADDPPRTRCRRRTRRPGARRRTRISARSTTSARSTGSTTWVSGSSRASSTRSPIRVVSSSIWARTSSSSSARASGDSPPLAASACDEQVEVGAQRGERRTQLVAGVGDQLPLPVARGGERGEHLVERRGQAGDLVVALDRQRGRGPRCGRSPRPAVVSRRTGRRPLRATAQPAMPARDHAGERRRAASPRRAWRASAPAAPGTGR